MNAVIAYQIHKMLRISHIRGRYDPPTRKRVGIESLVVYFYAFVLAAIATWHMPVIPFKGGDYGGLAYEYMLHNLSPKQDIAEVEKEEQNTEIADASNRSPLDISVSDRLREEGI